MRYVLAASLALQMVSPCIAADTVLAKQCIMSAASKLPLVPGLTITGSKAQELQPKEAISSFVRSFPNLKAFLAVSGQLDDQTMALINVRPPEKWAETIIDRITTNGTELEIGYEVTITVNAVQQETTYGFSCMIFDGSAVTNARGIVE